MRLIVTGASGLLGTRLSEMAVEKGHEVYSAYSQHRPLHGTPLKVDITDEKDVETMFEKAKPEAVVHAAAFSDVDKCEKEKELAWKTNAEATAGIAELCGTHDAFLVYVSTDYVFNGEKGKYKETDRPAPINYYGLTKLKGEEHVKLSKADYCIARTSVLYGANPATGKTNFALWFLDKLKGKEQVRIVTDQWNSPTLNTNLAQMILEVVERRLGGIIHLAGATRLSRFEFAQHLSDVFNVDFDYVRPASSKEMSWVAERPRDSSLDVEKASRKLRCKPMRILEALEMMKDETGQ